MEQLLQILGLLFAIGIGMGCGSYATMPYYRLPNKIPCGGKWTGEKSACPNCGAQLRTRDLFPVLNWLWTRGKCFKCQAVVNPIYFFIEFSCTILSVILYMKFGFDQIYIISMGLATCLVIITMTQYSYQVIPDPVLIVIIMLGFLYRAILDGQIYDMVQSFAFAALVSLALAKIYEKIKSKEVKSFGLLKLISVTGIWLNLGQFAFYILFAGMFVTFTVIFSRMFGRSATMLFGGALGIPFLVIICYPGLNQRFLDIISSGAL